MSMSLGDAFPQEQQRLRELIAVYLQLPNGVGQFGAHQIQQVLKRADAAAISGDLVAQIAAYKEMTECE